MDDKETKDVQVEEKKSKKQSIIALLITLWIQSFRVLSRLLWRKNAILWIRGKSFSYLSRNEKSPLNKSSMLLPSGAQKT